MVEFNIMPKLFLAELFGYGLRSLEVIPSDGSFDAGGQAASLRIGNGSFDAGGQAASLQGVGGRVEPWRGGDKPKKNYLGLPVFTTIILAKGNKWLVMPDAIAIVNRPKVIVKTPVAGRDGTVKEIIAWDDYQIEIKAVLANGISQTKEVNGKDFNISRWYPDEKVNRLLEIANHHGVITLKEPMLNGIMKINKVVIEEVNFIETPQVTNVQVVSIKCVSDQPIELQLIK